ncbi:aminotransferase class V-fold PLP-dependent enzyme [Propionicimonas sp.]|uniref:aminotransferase class V-fold PLP-dependent enzyme n=1 Tax=Propionicimonas sp. TaxID=1955623 RepID=UPI0039E61A37
MTALLTDSSMPLTVPGLAGEFDVRPGYLAAATCGVAPRRAVAALQADLELWRGGLADPGGYDGVVARTRASYAAVAAVAAERVAIGSQTSALVATIAASLPEGSEVLVAAGDFTSIVHPFLASGRLRVREAPLAELAGAVTRRTALVAFSLVQSATGEVADADAVAAAARACGAATLVDLTQAAGVLPVEAGRFDATVCHAYKWLCAPRGVAFLTLSPGFAARLRPVAAGWYAGRDPWDSIYGTRMDLAADARRFDVSPAWQAFVGAEVSIGLFAAADVPAIWQHASSLGAMACRVLGVPEQRRAIVTLPDPDGSRLARLATVGIRASGRAGRLRLAFHVWNTADDVAAVAAALA